MSFTVIASILMGIFLLLITIAYINNVLENKKLEAARRCTNLSDLIRRCGILNLVLPSQMMTPTVRDLLRYLELSWSDMLLSKLPKKANHQKLRDRIEYLSHPELHSQEPTPNNPSLHHIRSESELSEMRRHIEDFYGVITAAGLDALLSKGEVRDWHTEARRFSSVLYVEYLTNLGKVAIQNRQWLKARHALDQAARFLTKKQELPDYLKRLEVLELQIQKIDRQIKAEQLAQHKKDTQEEQLAEQAHIVSGGDKKNFYD